MKRTSLSNGAWIGGITGVGLLASLYLANRIFGTPFVPLDFWNWQALTIPRNLLSLAASGIGDTLAKLIGAPEAAWGKASEQLIALFLFVALCTAGGWIVARVKATEKCEQPPAGIWVGTGLFLLTAAMELSLGHSSVVLPLIWLAAAFIGWGALLDAFLDGRLPRSQPRLTRIAARIWPNLPVVQWEQRWQRGDWDTWPAAARATPGLTSPLRT